VQLEHDEEETSWESHGWVAVCDAEGNELVRSDDVQHNRNYSQRVATMKRMAEDVTAACEAAAA